jgi:hypothetical protein
MSAVFFMGARTIFRSVRICAAMRALTTLLATVATAAVPIPTDNGSVPPFQGHAAKPNPVVAPAPPRHPFMAPNARSNIHDDAYQTDTYQGLGPLGSDIKVSSTMFNADCGSVTFDAKGRIVTVCVGIAGPTLRLLDPKTLDTLAEQSLPPRDPRTLANLFTNFAGGGYFFLDNQDRAVVPTTTRHVLVYAETRAPGFTLARDIDLTSVVPDGDSIISALPDWQGRLWFATTQGVVGYVDEAGTIVSKALGEPIGNSFAVDEEGGVYIVSDAALYRFEGVDGEVRTIWRETYDNIGIAKPGQSEKGSGTTPTLMGKDLVSITDNADPMAVLVFKRARTVEGPRLICRQPVFANGASDTDQSLIGTPTSMVVENNYGYSGPASVTNGKTTTPGLARVNLDKGGGCHTAWTSNEVAPSVVAKLSLGAGLVYTYTKGTDSHDPWFLTTLDFRTGKTVYKALAGSGLGYNNNYAPVTLGPDGTAYVGTLGGLVALRDATTGHGAVARRPALKLTQRCVKRHRVALRLRGQTVNRVTFSVAGHRIRTDRRGPFTATVRARRGAQVKATVTLADGSTTQVRRKLRACR